MNRHIFIGLTGLLVLTAICFFWGANQTIANTQTSVGTQTSADIQTAIDQSHKTGEQRRQDAIKAINDALNQGMGPAMTTDAQPMSTAPSAATPKAGPRAKTAVLSNPLYPGGNRI
jgi:hypothetical protein